MATRKNSTSKRGSTKARNNLTKRAGTKLPKDPKSPSLARTKRTSVGGKSQKNVARKSKATPKQKSGPNTYGDQFGRTAKVKSPKRSTKETVTSKVKRAAGRSSLFKRGKK